MRYQRGFSLIELLIALAIAGIIAMVAIPSYNNSVMKSRRADAKGALTEAAAMQERIYSESYSYVANNELNRVVPNSDGVSSREGFYQLSIDVSGCAGPPYDCYTMTATAVGAQAGDDQCATLSINHMGQKTSAPSANCW